MTNSMTGYLITRGTGTDFREQIVRMVVDKVQLSESHHSGVRNRLPRLYDLWRGNWTGRFHPHKNNIHIPLIYSAIWADAARKAATSFGQWPLLTFAGYGPDDMKIARKHEALFSAQARDMDLFLKEVDNFVTADLYGVGITQVGWRRDEPMRIIEDISRLPISGQIVRSIRKGKVVMFDGPDTEPVDRLDFFNPPNVKSIPKMKGAVRRRFLDIDDCRGLVEAGMFDRAEFNRMVSDGGVFSGAASQEASTVQRFQVRTGMDEESSRFLDKYSRPIEILEYWGTVPSEFAPDGVYESRVITVANRRYLFRNKPNPFWHNKLPFIAFSPTPDPHYFDATGKAEIAEKIQIVANRYINQSLDAADLIIDPVWFYDRSVNLNTRNLYMKPGRFIGLDGDPQKSIWPMQSNLQNLSVADSKVAQMRELVQMGTAIQEDVTQGMGGGDRQTAREFVGRREASGTRLNLESMIYEQMYLEPLANMCMVNNKQMLEAPVEVMILGDNATIDQVTGEYIQATREQLNEYDMIQTYAARAMGATSALSKSMKQQNLIQLLTAMGSMPEVLGAINQVNFWRSVFREFEVPNINEIFVPQPAGGNPLATLASQATGGQGGVENVPTSPQLTQSPMPGIGMGNEAQSPIATSAAA